ncbi:hypothetical protein [Qipengyuania vesicularis]|uniref:hypothetical protein n=1 Tax=Qipengyuania vesicularis TaxID=2867232 RepID=UPI001C876E91|nr:hypothetical protein [Qipengyuania vesicularis]MBX7526613.1 hypothetical protein [Qipengyuania vesicularis]
MIELVLILAAIGAAAWVLATRANGRIAIGTAGVFLCVGLAVLATLEFGLVSALDPAVNAVDGAWRELAYALIAFGSTAFGLAILTIKLLIPRAKTHRH